jgi:putative ABC transport system permease protein
MYWRILKKALRRKERRLTVAWLSMVVTAALATLLWSLSVDVGAKMSREVKTAGPNLVIAPRMDSGSKTLTDEQVDDILASLPREAMDAVAAMVVGVGRIGEQNLILVGVDFTAAQQVFPYWQVEGLWPRRRNEVLVGAELATRLTLAPGDSVTLAGASLETSSRLPVDVIVAGILHTGAAEEWQVFGETETIQNLIGKAGEVSVLQLRLNARGDDIVSLATSLEGQFAQIEASPVLKIAKTEAILYRTLKVMLALVTLLSVFLTLLSLATGLTAVVFQRQKEIATMKVLGARTARVWALLLGEILALSSVAAVVGIGIGLVSAQLTEQMIFGSDMSLRWEVLPGVLAAVVVSACIAAILPFRRAVAVTPGIVLRGE